MRSRVWLSLRFFAVTLGDLSLRLRCHIIFKDPLGELFINPSETTERSYAAD